MTVPSPRSSSPLYINNKKDKNFLKISKCDKHNNIQYQYKVNRNQKKKYYIIANVNI